MEAPEIEVIIRPPNRPGAKLLMLERWRDSAGDSGADGYHFDDCLKVVRAT